MNRDWESRDTKTVRTKPKPEKTDWFLDNLPENAEILDFGAGIGRWASLLAAKRPDITIDALDERAGALEKHYVRIPQITDLIECKFEDYHADKQYDGIWARSSLIQLPEDKLPLVFEELANSLKHGGVLEFNFMAPSGLNNQENYHPQEKEKMVAFVNAAGLDVEQIIDETGVAYGPKQIELPTYIIRARKPL